MSSNISGTMNGYAEAYAEKSIPENGMEKQNNLSGEDLAMMRMDLAHCHYQCKNIAEIIHKSERNKAAYDYLVTINSVTELLSKI